MQGARKRKIKAKTSTGLLEEEKTTPVQEETEKKDGGESPEVCVFVKKRRLASNLRNREKNPLYQTTSTDNKAKETAQPETKTVVMVAGDDLATATVSTETERDRDAVAIEQRGKQLQKEAREKQDNAYRGKAGYIDYLAKEDTSGQIKGAGIKAGPVRGTLYARAISRWDYQPDICKDYKETGYCGYGDSCKFMHDRGDYKRGWELEKEWEEQQKAKSSATDSAKTAANQNEEDDSFPFACFVCRGPFVDPVKTKCGHFFCERCAVKQCKLNCDVCGKPTNGAFSVASKIERQKLEESAKRAAAAAAAQAENNNEDEEEEEGN